MIDIVSLEEVKQHLYLNASDTTHDIDLNLKIEMVSDMVYDHLKLTEIPDEWQSEDSPPITTVPPRIKGCALLILGTLYSSREGYIAGSINPDVDIITNSIRRILKRPPTFS